MAVAKQGREPSKSQGSRGMGAESEAGWHSFWESLCVTQDSAVFFLKPILGAADHLLHPCPGTPQTLSLPLTETSPGRTAEETEGREGHLPRVAQLLRVHLGKFVCVRRRSVGWVGGEVSFPPGKNDIKHSSSP